jgi:hypothetical protein
MMLCPRGCDVGLELQRCGRSRHRGCDHPASTQFDQEPGAAACRDTHPLGQVQVHLTQDLFAQLVFFQQVPELALTVVSYGTGSQPKSTPTNYRITSESYSASSTAGSERFEPLLQKYTRSMRSTPTSRHSRTWDNAAPPVPLRRSRSRVSMP